MIEVQSSKNAQTPGKERLEAMEHLRQTVTAIPKRKIGMAMMAMLGLVAYVKTLLGGSEVAAQTAPDTALEADNKAAPICEMDNSSADNSGSMSFGNADLFQADAGGDARGMTQTSSPPVLSSASSGLQPQRFDLSTLQPALLNVQPTTAAATTGPDTDAGGATDPITPPSGGGAGGGDVTPRPPINPDPEDQDGDGGMPTDPKPPVTPPTECEADDCDRTDDDEDIPIDSCNAPCNANPCLQDGAEDAPCEDANASCDHPPSCDADQACDSFAGTDADCFEDPRLAIRDFTFGQSTADHLLGTVADDLIYAGDGADTVWGGAGDDLLIGAVGDDNLIGGDGNDRLAGGQGADTLDGGAGDDILTGGAHDDVFWDGSGADLLFGDDGNDTFYLATEDAPDLISGGAGMDTLVLSAGSDPAHIDITAGTITRAHSQQDTFKSIEIFTASTGKEVFDLSGFTTGAVAAPQTVFQLTNFGHDDTLVLADDIHLALSDLHQVTDRRDIRKDSSDFEARISAFDPETVAETHGRLGFRADDQDALMIRRIELYQDHENGELEFNLWISGPDHVSDPFQDFTS